ncbi:MAG: hypothetical protein VB066_10940 [Paludibacter sp.]|nr:hypothetical protein [Paludibacter sp.]
MNYLLTYENVDDFIANIFNIISEAFYFIYIEDIYLEDTYLYYNNIEFVEFYDFILNQYSIKNSRNYNDLVERKPEFQNLIVDLENEFQDYMLNLDFMYTILHPGSIIYEFAENLSYKDVLFELKNYMIEKGVAIQLSSFNRMNLLKKNNSLKRRITPEFLFTDRFKKLSNNELTVSFWCVYVYSLMKDGLKTDETDYGSFFAGYIDDDIISEDYKVIYCVPNNSNMDKDQSDLSDDYIEDDSLDEFFADDED